MSNQQLHFLKISKPQGDALIELQSVDGRWRSVGVHPAAGTVSMLVYLQEPVSQMRCTLLKDGSHQDIAIEVRELPSFLAPLGHVLGNVLQDRALPIARKEYAIPVSASGAKQELRDWLIRAKERQKLARLGLNDDNPYVRANPKLDEGWPEPQAPSHLTDSQAPRLAVVLHLHYPETWGDFKACLHHMPEPFELLVTLTQSDHILEAQIARDFPGAKITIVENRGRDVWPFLSMLQQGQLDSYDLVCKLHSKQSREGTSLDMVRGRRWRRRILLDLLGSSNQVRSILDQFESDPRLGIVGPTELRMPNQWVGEKAAWSRSHSRVNELASKLTPSNIPEIDYFAGTMFWLRPGSLGVLKSAGFALEDFPEEPSMRDGELHHALERMFIHVAKHAGFKTGKAQPYMEDQRLNDRT